ncbi:MAG: transglycosylase SLT domain-containing protein [Myxococcales bacterium]|nr:transglycosylase SLT domain-containing protein [Myxococcales bacterium]
MIHTSFRSTTYRTIRSFEEAQGVALRLADVSDNVEMEEQLKRVHDGVYEAIVVDEPILDLARASGLEVEARWPVSDPLPKAWAVHPDASDLQSAADAFLSRAIRRGLVRVMYARYYKAESLGFRRAADVAYRVDQSGAISPFDDLFKRAGDETGIDWRLLAAVAYAETRFDPAAISHWGAVGLMQVLPSTARRVGIYDPATAWGSVQAGARYLRRLIEFFGEDGVEKRQRVRFALASYNAGLGHIQDARKLAASVGKDPNRWFGNVEEALRLKQDPRWHQRTRHGYARARETLAYVSRVQSQYEVFVRHMPLARASSGEGLED